MIQLTKLFTPVEALDGEETKAYLAAHPEGSYTLLDVRQPWEYEEEHLAGAKLIPLADLKDSLEELDQAKPTLVYCAVGGRSRVAAQLLSGYGFKEVYNVSGGIKGYHGVKAGGPQELNLEMVRGDETPSDMLALAFGLEQALQLFYRTVSRQTSDQDLTDLLGKLADIEQNHKKRLHHHYLALNPGSPDLTAFEASVKSEIMEGGFQVHDFMAKNKAYLDSVPHVLELALMLETQALDLYLRFAAQSRDPQTKAVLFTIADEEKAHQAALSRLLDQKR